jgi:rhomboid protease GluP
MSAIQKRLDLGFYFGTWSGRIIALNFFVFVAMCIDGGSLLVPPEAILLKYGAKEPVLVATGEWWRLISPMFVHIGVLHFLINSYALKSIGPQIEKAISPRWFLTVYAAAGIIGNVASGAFNLRISAGASGAIFGLIGSGVVTEYLLKRRLANLDAPRMPAQNYLGLAFANLMLGVLIPGIDNAAHIGGFVSGIITTTALMVIKRNWLVGRRPAVGYGLIIFQCIVTGVLTNISADAEILSDRLRDAGDKAFQQFLTAEEHEERIEGGRNSYAFYSSGIRLDPTNPQFRLKRGRLLLLAGEQDDGMADLSIAASDLGVQEQLRQLIKELTEAGRLAEAEEIRNLIRESQGGQSGGTEDSAK